MNYVSSSSANGSIGYVEYSYALGQNYPVAKLLNSAGYYTLPTQYNVAVALEQAQINMDKSSPNYLLQNLDHVYTDRDARTYPLSSYVVHDHPDREVPVAGNEDHHGEAADASPTSSTTRSARGRRRSDRSVTRRCRSTSCRPASVSCRS